MGTLAMLGHTFSPGNSTQCVRTKANLTDVGVFNLRIAQGDPFRPTNLCSLSLKEGRRETVMGQWEEGTYVPKLELLWRAGKATLCLCAPHFRHLKENTEGTFWRSLRPSGLALAPAREFIGEKSH